MACSLVPQGAKGIGVLTAKESSLEGGGKGRRRRPWGTGQRNVLLNLENRLKECITLELLKVCQVEEGFYQTSGQLEPIAERFLK